ncbi:centrosomal protein of 170 kDa protein B [Neosynchiropus ocellatus]
MSVTSWFLVSSSGSHHRLPKELIFVGREDCELMLQSRSVDKQHAVINYDGDGDRHLVKDLGSLNGTFVNNLKIPDQTYVALRASDMLRFGYDSHNYVLEKREHKVPEEALKHEKYSSQLNLKKQEEPDDQGRSKTQGVSEVSISRTPLYGQPSWWGEEDHVHQHHKKEALSVEHHTVPSTVQDIAGSDSSVFSLFQSNCFEIPTQDVSSVEGTELHEIPTKDTDTLTSPNQTQPVVQSHASFTIEFDSGAPGKMKIKDHITKFSMRQRKAPSPAVSSAEALTAESKVADWLVHADVRRMRQHETSEDVLSTKSDLAVHGRMLRGHHHEDGTQSDSEEHQPDPHRPQQRLERRERSVDKEPESLPPESREFPEENSNEKMAAPAEQLPHQAFIIEFFDDDNPRKKRSQSFTHNPTNKQERRRGAERPASVHGHAPPAHPFTGPMRMVGLGSQSRSSSLKREKTDGDAASASSASRGSSGLRHLSSMGKKLAPDLLHKLPTSAPADRMTAAPFSTSSGRKPLQVQPCPTESRMVAASPPGARAAGLKTEEDDSLSDAGTYTIDTEGPDQEVEQARNMIDQVFGVLDSFEISGVGRLADTVKVRCASSPQTPGPVLENKKMNVPGDLIESESPKWVSRWASLVDPSSASPVQSHDLGRTQHRTRRLLPQVPSDQLGAASHDGAPDQSHAEDVDPDSLSDASRSDDGQKARSLTGGPSLQSTCFFIDSEDCPTRLDRPPSPAQPLPAKIPPTSVVIRHLSRSDAPRTGIKPNHSAPNLHLPDRDLVSIVRQESFTRDHPNEVQIKTLPHISSQPSLQTQDAPEPEGDLHLVRAYGCVNNEGSGESDVDTASTVSQVSGKNTPVCAESRRNSHQRDKSSSGPLAQQKKKSFPGPGQKRQPPTARERLSEKRRHQGESVCKSEEGKGLQSRRNTGTCGSLDTLKKQLGSGHVWTEPAGQDSSNRSKKAPDVKASRTPQVLTRSNSLSAPRPTRASMLRRARLGDASDTDGGDTDRASQNSDHKGSADGKKLSRLDVLALPRRRTGSFNGPSDSEGSAVSRTGLGKSTSEASAETKKFPAGKGGAASVKTQPTRTAHHTTAKTAAHLCTESRSSSSEDELALVNPPKHSKHSKARSSRPVSVETEEDEDPYQNWSNHSAEIAKLSQDLAKDLAILAREIHDVAGDGELPGSGNRTTPTSLPAMPAPVREELVQHIPEVGLSYQKVPRVSAGPANKMDSNMNRSEPGSESHTAWNRQEVVLDNLMLSPVSQLSHMIRQNTEQLAQKMKVLLGNKADLWEEFESRINTDTEIPVLKTSNQEISAILMELRRVQRQLEAINSLVDAPPAVKEKKRSATLAPRSARGSDRATKS